MAQGTSEICRARRGERGMVADAARARLRSMRSIMWYGCAVNGFSFGYTEVCSTRYAFC